LRQNIIVPNLSTDLDDPAATPYFLWDEPMTVAELKRRLAESADPERYRILAKIMREARDTDVWHFTTPGEVRREWNQLSQHLGRRRLFWEFLFEFWEKEGLLA
jgi:hypothetical protein